MFWYLQINESKNICNEEDKFTVMKAQIRKVVNRVGEIYYLGISCVVGEM